MSDAPNPWSNHPSGPPPPAEVMPSYPPVPPGPRGMPPPPGPTMPAAKPKRRVLLPLVAAAIAVVALVLSGISFARGNGWKHRAQTAEQHQHDLNEQLNDSEADAKSLEGRLATVANMSAKSTDAKAYAESVISSVSRLADHTDALQSDTGDCTIAVDDLRTILGPDPAAPLDPTKVRAAATSVVSTCGALGREVTTLRDEIDGIGQ